MKRRTALVGSLAAAAGAATAGARAETRSRLDAAPDLARALTRLVMGRGGPRDLAAIRDGIAAAAGLATQLDTASATSPLSGFLN